jgi:Rps23 Pro-64 3,4-dihydroxylase Tpa1-like proline 4-hydroxylase
MNIIESKEKLKKDGYTWFNLKDFDENFYNYLLPLKCNETKNIQSIFTQLRADEVSDRDSSERIRISDNYGTFENAKRKKEELYQELQKIEKQIISRPIPADFSQIWYYSDFSDASFQNTDININKTDYFNMIKKLMMYFYDFPETQEYSGLSMFTYYDKNCKLQNHSDGTGTGRVCALLIYFNEKYNVEDGGILILNDREKVIPEFGNVAIIDLQTFDIKHMVTEVGSGIGRYALLTFVKTLENQFVDKY